MAKATWKGEEATPDLKETTRFGIVFKKGEAVEITDPEHYRKLKGNPSFTLDGAAPKHPEVLDTALVRAPSETRVPGAVDKPGEPVAPKVADYEPPPEPPPEEGAARKAPVPPAPPKPPVRRV